jgi:hypothetical protein
MGIFPISAMIYEIGCYGESLHSYDGYAAIGSGAHVATSHLMLLGQARHRTLSETIFNVAVAKFASEKSDGLDVGQNTALWISRKRVEGDEHQFSATPVSDGDIKFLRDLWVEHVRLKIPDEARQPISSIAAALNKGKSTFRDLAECLNASNRLQKKKIEAYEEIKAAIEPDPQSTTDDQSHPPPSPESPGETDES